MISFKVNHYFHKHLYRNDLTQPCTVRESCMLSIISGRFLKRQASFKYLYHEETYQFCTCYLRSLKKTSKTNKKIAFKSWCVTYLLGSMKENDNILTSHSGKCTTLDRESMCCHWLMSECLLPEWSNQEWTMKWLYSPWNISKARKWWVVSNVSWMCGTYLLELQ